METCDRLAVTRGRCHGHYVRWNRGGDVKADVPLIRAVVDLCTIDGCGRGATGQRVAEKVAWANEILSLYTTEGPSVDRP